MNCLQPLYCLLKDGRQMICWSDNRLEQTVTVFPVNDLPDFNPEVQLFETVSADQVVRMSRNRLDTYDPWIECEVPGCVNISRQTRPCTLDVDPTGEPVQMCPDCQKRQTDEARRCRSRLMHLGAAEDD